MAVENVNNALKQFESDENLFDKLDEKEKSEISKVEKKDCQAAKDTLGWKKVNGVKLSELMKTFEYNVKHVNGRNVYESFVTINGTKKKIDTRSDLWALIQMYALANWVANVWSTGIDWSIWEKTITGLNQAKLIPEKGNNGNKIDTNETDNTYKWEWVTQRTLDDHAFNKDFDSIRNGLYDEYVTNKVLKQSGFLTHTVTESERNAGKFNLTYTRNNWETKTVVINLKKTNNTINTKTLAEDIKMAVEKSENSIEAEIQRKSIQEWIDDYNERSIKDPLMKSYLTKTEKDFKYGWMDNGLVKIINTKTGNYWSVNKNVLLGSDNKFSSWKFAWELVNHYKTYAINREKDKLAKVKKDTQGKNTTDKIKDYKSIINEINGFWDKYQNAFATERTDAYKQKEYYEVVNKVSNAKKTIENPKSTQQDMENALKGVVTVEDGVSNGVAIKIIDYSNNWRAKYAAVGQKDGYNNAISSLVKKVYQYWYKEVNK